MCSRRLIVGLRKIYPHESNAYLQRTGTERGLVCIKNNSVIYIISVHFLNVLILIRARSVSTTKRRCDAKRERFNWNQLSFGAIIYN